MLEIDGQDLESISRSARPPSRRERRRKQLADWREKNREHLRQYLRSWKLQHPDRVKVHRAAEYRRRRQKRRRARLRRKAQRSRRALQKKTRIMNPIAWAALTGRNNETIGFSAPGKGYAVD